jgi:hypothetical protein
MTNPYASGRSWTPEEEKVAAVLVHALSIPFEFLAPIIGYAAFKDRGPFINHHSKEALNFSLTMLIAYAALAISIVGWLVIWAVPLYALVWRIIAAAKASQGEFYKYPLTIRFIK